jgi:hypothetical protein
MLLRHVIDAMPGLVVYIDRDYRYRFANCTYRKWLQRDPLGQEIVEMLGEANFERVRDGLGRALAGEQMEFEDHIRYRDWERDVHLILYRTAARTGRYAAS